MNPQDLGILVPAWRAGQLEAINNSRFAKKRFVIQNAPVGSGKSIILMGESRMSNQRTLILTGTRPLQTQYNREFANLNILDLRGKSNYSCRATESGGEWYDGSPAKSVADGPCQYGVECGLKAMGCVYYDLLRRATYEKLVVSNYAAWISSNLFADGWGHFPLIMCDEAHEAEGWLRRVLSVHLPLALEMVLGVQFPRQDTYRAWAEWARRHYPTVKAELTALTDSTRKGRGNKTKVQLRVDILKQAESAMTRIKAVTEDWLITRDRQHINFQPVWVHKYAERYLFKGATKVVLASATIVPYEVTLLGIPKENSAYFEYPSTFPVKNRPIYFFPTVKMKHGMDAEDNLSWIAVVDEFISKRLDRKGIIHTVSFARQKALLSHSRFASLMLANVSSATSQSTLQRFKASKAPVILVTPSMGTGVNLPYKDAEYAIIPKIPFENPYDPLLMAKSAEDPEHGYFQAAKTLLQMVGRIVRAEDDRGETLITDTNFQIFRTKYKYLLPQYFWQAFQKIDELPEPPEAL
jgi:Rad3-related DNA helicase